MTELSNPRWVLASRPSGAPSLDNFRWETGPAPRPGDGEMLLQTLELSLDPYMRGRMGGGSSYAAAVDIGAVMLGGTVSRVLESRHPGFAAGDLVSSYNGWQAYAVSDGAGVVRLDPGMAKPSWALGALGLLGLAAWRGVARIIQPSAGQTVVVDAAVGGVGSVAGQLARLRGAHVVGVAGGPDKCAYAVETLGYHACIDHRGGDLAGRLKAACPNGVDGYFQNVGGEVLSALLGLFNPHARIAVCGILGALGADPAPGALFAAVLTRRLTIEGFIVSDHDDETLQAHSEVGDWISQGRLVVNEDIVDGLEGAPEAFMRLLAGQNFGKLVVHLAD